eukprot:1701708-Alexandrium_andersonii.AAC.1
MSASLVGSEMCIRDRRSAWHLSLDARSALDAWATAKRLATASTVPAAVSYTHLTLPTICSV